MGSLNNMAGGGARGEQNEDMLDKGERHVLVSFHSASASGLANTMGFVLVGVDFVQEHVLGQGQQSNESAMEQMKDEQISDAIRRAYKGSTGKAFPVQDK